ncbi:hypothetical protein GCM10008171_26230 [Methylopila jiangsuensis]|uniref:Uncharacterized protein n=1 Tax=Methylopila jiangsuensis TaxID=586230 RepID=A0A9W6JJT3_9HYPH|nr:hypothetical protein [Methylopila jiangsuensis]MDR6285241.1 hypothetical protein [Methylopila jiangsuensis]GLK77369.1 hypothetical protein GCM10008171_26230 [Methylopila jiangsuensis]
MTTDLFELWRRQMALANGFAAMGPFAGFVMATRIAQMTREAGAPTPAGVAEAQRMVSEKMSAAFEGGVAAGRVLSRMSCATTPIAAAGLMVAAGEAAIRPANRRLRANARRLSRTGR